MKHILFIAAMFVALWACNEDETSFGIMMPGENLRFEAKAGGSMMYYTLPKDESVYGLIVRYTNEVGKEVMKRASYVGDSLFLDGFNKAHTAVPAQLSLIDKNNKESETIDITFDTKESAPYTLLSDAVVTPSWEGFQLIYRTPEVVTGTAHVFYLGTDPKTGKPDTLLMKSFPILPGGDTLVFKPKQNPDNNTVVVRTENGGYRVGEKVWENVEAYRMTKWPLKPENFKDFGLAVKSEDAALGVQYLFDGELKGMEKYRYGISDPYNKVEKQFSFLAGPSAFGKPFVIDLGEKKVPAALRIYSMQSIPVKFPYPWDMLLPFYKVWQGAYQDKLPCDVTVYAGNDSDPGADTWVKVGSYSQPRSTLIKERWCYPVEMLDYRLNTVEEIEAADPIFMEVSFLASENTYRYLKFVVNDTFSNREWDGDNDRELELLNLDDHFTMQELEVYVKKD